jgi:uncharacterized protein (UPF0332 family)
MNEEMRLQFERAQECVEDAQILVKECRLSGTAARAYYAMFHAATAALLKYDIKRGSHQGIIAAFGEHICRQNLLDKKFHKYLREAFDLRLESDYQPVVRIDIQLARETLNRAIEFVNACKDLCKQ